MTGEESVHLALWPEADTALIDTELEQKMQQGMDVASVILMRRKTNQVPVKIPLKKVSYLGPQELSDEIAQVVCDEVNAYELMYRGESEVYESGSENGANEYTDEGNQDKVAGQARDIVRKI